MSYTITDSSGCQISNSFTVTQPNPTTYCSILDSISCFGGNDGLQILLEDFPHIYGRIMLIMTLYIQILYQILPKDIFVSLILIIVLTQPLLR